MLLLLIREFENLEPTSLQKSEPSMSVPQQGGIPPPSSASLTLSASDLSKTNLTTVNPGVSKPTTQLVSTAKVPLISHHPVIPRPILAAPTVGSAQLKVIHTSSQGQTASMATQELPVDLAAPKGKSTGQTPTTISSVIGHATMQPVPTAAVTTATSISIAASTTTIASNVKLGSSSTTATPIQTLRIPTIPAVSTLRTGTPQVISAPHVLHGTRTNVTLPRAPGQPALAVAVPKTVQGTIPNLAVVHQVPQVGGNKVTVLQQGANIISRGKTTTFQAAG